MQQLYGPDVFEIQKIIRPSVNLNRSIANGSRAHITFEGAASDTCRAIYIFIHINRIFHCSLLLYCRSLNVVIHLLCFQCLRVILRLCGITGGDGEAL